MERELLYSRDYLTLPVCIEALTDGHELHLGEPGLLCLPILDSMCRLHNDVTANSSGEDSRAGATVVAVTVRVAIAGGRSRWPDVLYTIQLAQFCLQALLLYFQISVAEVNLL